MKSHIFSLTLLLLACLGMAACSEHDWTDIEQPKGIELSVSCANIGITRATKPGELDYNENLIKTLHYFLYPLGETSENAVISGKMDIDGGRQGNVVVRIPLNETELNTVLFPITTNSRTCEVYLIANLPEGMITETSNTSLDALKELIISTDFNANTTQASFIMDGQCTADLISRNKTIVAEGEIELKRLAAKFTTRISVTSSFTDTDGKVYTPLVEEMRIHLNNAGKETTLSGAFATELFDYNQRKRIGTKTENVDETSTTYNIFAPFYSYPRRWNYDNNALVMYIMLPWTYQQNGETKNQNCFYKVYLNTMQLDRNNWHNLDLNIGVLGSFSQEEELVTLTDFRYKVVDWKNGYDDWNAGVNLETEILSSYYLVVDQNEYVVNNKNTFEIPFISSHECIIKDYNGNTDNNTANDFKVTKKIFVENDKPVNKDLDITAQARTGNWITIEGNTIKLNHTLNNDFINTDTYDYSPYVFTFTLCHRNNPDKFQERITIIQKPALSITAHLNSLYEYSSGKTITGYVYVNSNAAGGGSTSYGNYGGVAGVESSGNNSNPYMYTIEVSVLPPGSNYILGDPRVKYVFGTDIAAQTSFASAASVEGTGNRRLTNYYGTIKDASAENMIAPKFRMASAHGRVSSSLQNYTNTLNRAASYQEDGYPAGRWRVPTMAEIWFVYKLYVDDFIPPLFYEGQSYWCASGKVKASGNGVTGDNDLSGTSPVRCVYDEWYWEHSQWPRMASRGNHPSKYNQFTWGDEVN